VFLGEASYAIYIIHLPVLVFLGFGRQRAAGTRLAGPLCLGFYVALVVGLGCLIAGWAEPPVLRTLKAWLRSRRWA
jgi:peptidoglycan/LPS O-acetylase OafA/YrhL